MKFTAVDVPHAYGSLYRGDDYDIRHYVCGFGIWRARVIPMSGRGAGVPVMGFAGDKALDDAMSWCAHRASIERQAASAPVDQHGGRP